MIDCEMSETPIKHTVPQDFTLRFRNDSSFVLKLEVGRII